MITRLGSCREVLVVAPHPDDETIGAFGLIHAFRRRGARVRILIVSDGAASHPGSVCWPPSRLVAERRRETLRAMATIGIRPPHIHFLGLPDGMLFADMVLLSRRCRRALRRMPPPDLIVGPVAEDAHADHRSVAAALAMPPATARRRLGYRVWPLGRPSGGRLILPLDRRVRAAKRRALSEYRTQGGRITDATAGMQIRAHHLRAFAGPVERFQLLR